MGINMMERLTDCGWVPMMPMMGFGMLFMAFFWVILFVGVLCAVKWFMRQGWTNQQEDSAMEILKKRYARGELTKQEFEDQKQDLLA